MRAKEKGLASALVIQSGVFSLDRGSLGLVRTALGGARFCASFRRIRWLGWEMYMVLASACVTVSETVLGAHGITGGQHRLAALKRFNNELDISKRSSFGRSRQNSAPEVALFGRRDRSRWEEAPSDAARACCRHCQAPQGAPDRLCCGDGYISFYIPTITILFPNKASSPSYVFARCFSLPSVTSRDLLQANNPRCARSQCTYNNAWRELSTVKSAPRQAHVGTVEQQ
ncbi:hypothetical protein BU23DRAFT_198443 [Bimuria novae-zelandiae CBS 107.79]|uniref:Uncharacterized protein n=1 Tax=Bimuria novae-zelandiae CBS 107.79 TaxID=1447943 RepID=A0A6A5V7N5_9PLEO|nr:hypothetical protein BU23DRAFT_198443 [Bimuria novae-zelandiae CBS 107.79]